MTNPHTALLQSMRDHANNLRRSILRDGPYANLFERAADEIERLTAIVLGLTAGAKRAGYDCSHCHAQIVFGDSVCPVTKEQHAAPKSSYVIYEKSGAVRVDLAAYLQSPEGKAQLDALTTVKSK